jgi:mRNA-degrading endonuclease HigB of HigAB toxin-antitoxin module
MNASYRIVLASATSMFPKMVTLIPNRNGIFLTCKARYAEAMIIVGRDRLDDAIKSGQLPPIAARCWLAEASNACWLKAKDVMKFYAGVEEIEPSRLLIPLDEAGHCIVAIVNYESRAMLITFAGHREGYSMESGRAGRP